MSETPTRIQTVYNNAVQYFRLQKEYGTDRKKKKVLKDAFETLYESIKLLEPQDVGIFEKKVYQDYYIFIPIYECELFAIWLFHLPKGNGLPLHDHPGHTILSKFLYGKFELTSVNIVKSNQDVLKGEINFESVINAKDGHMEVISDVYPGEEYSRGNLHSIKPIEPIAFVDVIYPPFKDQKGNTNVKNYKILERKGPRLNLKIDDKDDTPFYTSDYQGPQIFVQK